jgi:hypothetical protein
MLTHHKKGQVAVLDLFIAAVIFGIIVTTVMFTWNSYNNKIDDRIEYNTNLLRAYHVTDLLTKYPGKPSFWERDFDLNEDTVTILGLAKSDRVIDPKKLSAFLTMNYSVVKSKLDLNNYEFYFKLENDDVTYEKGMKINDSPTIAIKRLVIYNETKTNLDFWLQG